MGRGSCGFHTKDRFVNRFIEAQQPWQSFVVGQMKRRTTTTAANCRAAFICLTDDSILHHGAEVLHQPSCTFQRGWWDSSSVGTESQRCSQLACLTGKKMATVSFFNKLQKAYGYKEWMHTLHDGTVCVCVCVFFLSVCVFVYVF